MNNESKFNLDQGSGSYQRPVHHREVKRGSTVRNDAPNASSQNLAASKGTDWAKNSLARRKNS